MPPWPGPAAGDPTVSASALVTATPPAVAVSGVPPVPIPLMALFTDGSDTDPAVPDRSFVAMLPPVWVTAPAVLTPTLLRKLPSCVVSCPDRTMPPVPALSCSPAAERLPATVSVPAGSAPGTATAAADSVRMLDCEPDRVWKSGTLIVTPVFTVRLRPASSTTLAPPL